MSTLARTLLLPAALVIPLLGACSGRDPEPLEGPVFRASTPESAAGSAPAANAESLPPQVTCENDASFIEDLSIPDGTVVQPGVVLDKRWSVRNSGSCDWGPNYRLVRLDEGGLVGPAEVALFPARAGTVATIQIRLEAPFEAGDHQAVWRARSPDGTLFGDEIFILIEVEAPPATDTPAPTPTAS